MLGVRDGGGYDGDMMGLLKSESSKWATIGVCAGDLVGSPGDGEGEGRGRRNGLAAEGGLGEGGMWFGDASGRAGGGTATGSTLGAVSDSILTLVGDGSGSSFTDFSIFGRWFGSGR